MVGDGNILKDQPDWLKKGFAPDANGQALKPTLPQSQASPLDDPVDIHLNPTARGLVSDPELDRQTQPSIAAMPSLHHQPTDVEELPTMPMSLIKLAREIRDHEQGPTQEMPVVSVKANQSAAPQTPDFGATQYATPEEVNKPKTLSAIGNAENGNAPAFTLPATPPKQEK